MIHSFFFFSSRFFFSFFAIESYVNRLYNIDIRSVLSRVDHYRGVYQWCNIGDSWRIQDLARGCVCKKLLGMFTPDVARHHHHDWWSLLSSSSLLLLLLRRGDIWSIERDKNTMTFLLFNVINALFYLLFRHQVTSLSVLMMTDFCGCGVVRKKWKRFSWKMGEKNERWKSRDEFKWKIENFHSVQFLDK